MKTFFDFMAQKWDFLQTNYIFFFSTIVVTDTICFISKFQNYEMQVNENLCLRKLETKQAHGLKGWRNWVIILLSLTEQLFIAQSPYISRSTWLKFCPIVYIYIYHTFQFVYQRCKFYPRPHISGHCFQITANFPTEVLALLR